MDLVCQSRLTGAKTTYARPVPAATYIEKTSEESFMTESWLSLEECEDPEAKYQR